MNNKNFIDQKKRDLARLESASESALGVVTNTIDRLDNINDQIDITIREISEAEMSLGYTKGQLNQKKAYNENIIKKFKELIGD